MVLIYAFMNLGNDDDSGPDLETASSLLESMKVYTANSTFDQTICLIDLFLNDYKHPVLTLNTHPVY